MAGNRPQHLTIAPGNRMWEIVPHVTAVLIVTLVAKATDGPFWSWAAIVMTALSIIWIIPVVVYIPRLGGSWLRALLWQSDNPEMRLVLRQWLVVAWGRLECRSTNETYFVIGWVQYDQYNAILCGQCQGRRRCTSGTLSLTIDATKGILKGTAIYAHSTKRRSHKFTNIEFTIS